MDYMMHMGLLAHKYLIYAYLAVLTLHLFKLLNVKDVSAYKRFMLIYNPMLVIPTLGGVMLSGLVMFAAIGFRFDIANSAMIVASAGLLMHEFKRSKELQPTLKEEFGSYKKRALRYIGSNFVIVFVTTFVAVKFAL